MLTGPSDHSATRTQACLASFLDVQLCNTLFALMQQFTMPETPSSCADTRCDKTRDAKRKGFVLKETAPKHHCSLLLLHFPKESRGTTCIFLSVTSTFKIRRENEHKPSERSRCVLLAGIILYLPAAEVSGNAQQPPKKHEHGDFVMVLPAIRDSKRNMPKMCMTILLEFTSKRENLEG